MKNIFKILGLAFLTTLFISCEEAVEKVLNSTETYKATLLGMNENPTNQSTAAGGAVLIYNKTTRIFTIAIQYDGFTPIKGHIHKGDTKTNGIDVFDLGKNLASTINYVSTPLTTEQEKDLSNGLYYVNLHSEKYQDGEIRGNLVKE